MDNKSEKRLGDKLELTTDVGSTEAILDNTLTCLQELEKIVAVKLGEDTPEAIHSIREIKSRMMIFCEQLQEFETFLSSVSQDVNQSGLMRLPPYRSPFSQQIHVSNPVLKKRKKNME